MRAEGGAVSTLLFFSSFGSHACKKKKKTLQLMNLTGGKLLGKKLKENQICIFLNTF